MQSTLDRIYDRIRTEERAALQQRVADAYRRAPRLAALDEMRQKLFADVGNRAITPEEGVSGVQQIEREEREILRSLGLAEDALRLHYRCELCRDTGYVGSAPKRPCACRLRYREKEKGGAQINSRETFEHFSEAVYPDEMQRRRAVNAKKLCAAYAEALPYPEKPNLLILGMPGLGKSYLGNAIAYAAIGKGIDTARVTAYRFVQEILSDLREHNGRARYYSSVPLMVLDDLGSEPEIPNVSVEWLFAVVNERALMRRATVCITNLSPKQLQQRYGERLMSRLIDRSTTAAIQLSGANLRTVAEETTSC